MRKSRNLNFYTFPIQLSIGNKQINVLFISVDVSLSDVNYKYLKSDTRKLVEY